MEGEAGGDRVEVRVAAAMGGQRAGPAGEIGDVAAALHGKRGAGGGGGRVDPIDRDARG